MPAMETTHTPKKKPEARLVLTVEETADALGISRAFAYELVRKGELPSIRLGRRIVVPRVQLARLVGVELEEDTDGKRHEPDASMPERQATKGAA